MSQVNINASSPSNLPSPITITTWIEEWQGEAGGSWGPYELAGSAYYVPFTGPSVETATPYVDSTIDNYNGTHPGQEVLYATWIDD